MTDTLDPALAADTDIDPPARGPRARSDDLWALARDAYLAGEAGASVAARHGISPTAFWRRAAEHGWRRRDRPVDAPPPFDPDRAVLDDEAQIALIDRRIAWALEAGADTTALRWMRMRDLIEDRQIRRLHAGERAGRAADRRAMAEVTGLTDAAREVERIARAGLANVETELRLQRLQRGRARPETAANRESKSAPTEPPVLLDPEAPGLTRAERRRRLKYAARHGKRPPD